jgi:hypothetical protein
MHDIKNITHAALTFLTFGAFDILIEASSCRLAFCSGEINLRSSSMYMYNNDVGKKLRSKKAL